MAHASDASISSPVPRTLKAVSFKAGNYHQACTIQDANGNTNAACKAKKWPSGRYETDPFGQSVLELFELTAQ